MASGALLTLGAWPAITPRLMDGNPGVVEGLDAFRARTDDGRDLRGLELLDAIATAGLRGRGGAAFPTARKLQAVLERPGPRFVVANGEEGEPASAKDRWLLRMRPHLVLDGVRRIAHMLDAERAFIYVSDASAAEALDTAKSELEELDVPLEIFTVEHAYVAGEESAVVSAINGGKALPQDKPPRPFQAGVAQSPTFIGNVETLAHVSQIASFGADWFRQAGTPTSAGTFLATISGACDRPGIYELPFGVGLGEAATEMAGADAGAVGYLMGGFFGGLIGPRGGDVALTPDMLAAAGYGLGPGAVVILGGDDCPIAATAEVMGFLARENAGQCGVCVKGTAAMTKVVMRIGKGTANAGMIDRLRLYGASLRGRGACGTLDGAAVLANSLLYGFQHELDRHLAESCALCAAMPDDPSATFGERFRLAAEWGAR